MLLGYVERPGWNKMANQWTLFSPASFCSAGNVHAVPVSIDTSQPIPGELMADGICS